MPTWWKLPICLLLVLAACRDRDSNSSPVRSSTTSTGPITTAQMPPATPSPQSPAPGSVTLRVSEVSLPTRADSFRVLLDLASNGEVTLALGPGGEGGRSVDGEILEACPISSLDVAPEGSGCISIGRGEPTGSGPRGREPVELRLGTGGGGVEIRHGSRSVQTTNTTVDVALTYVPNTRKVTLLLPPLGPGGEGPQVTMVPSLSGSFRLEARPSGGRPRLALVTGPVATGSVLATVEGGTRLSINATVDGSRGATLVYVNAGTEVVPALRMETEWP